MALCMRKVAVQTFGGAYVSCMRFFWRLVCAKVVTRAVNADRRSIIIVDTIDPARAFRPLARFHVALVLLVRCLAKIIPTIVRAVSVAMVYIRARLTPCLHFEDQAMGQEFLFSNSAADVGNAALHPNKAAEGFATPTGVGSLTAPYGAKVSQRPNAPNEASGFRFVIETLAQIRRVGHNLSSHWCGSFASAVRDDARSARSRVVLLIAPMLQAFKHKEAV